MKAVKVLRKLLIAVLVMTVFLVFIDKLRNSRKFQNFVKFDETPEKAPGFSKRKYITIR